MRFFFALSASLRHSIAFGLFDRPLFLAMLASAVSGQWESILPLGIFLELFWLDSVPLGSVVPPLQMFSFWLLMPLTLHFSWKTPGPMLFPLFLAALCAYGGAGLERWLRLYRNTVRSRILLWINRDSRGESPARAIGYAILLRIGLLCFFYLIAYVAIGECTASLQARNLLPKMPHLTWPMMYTIAALGALLSLRTRQSYTTLFLALGSVLVYLACA